MTKAIFLSDGAVNQLRKTAALVSNSETVQVDDAIELGLELVNTHLAYGMSVDYIRAVAHEVGKIHAQYGEVPLEQLIGKDFRRR